MGCWRSKIIKKNMEKIFYWMQRRSFCNWRSWWKPFLRSSWCNWWTLHPSWFRRSRFTNYRTKAVKIIILRILRIVIRPWNICWENPRSRLRKWRGITNRCWAKDRGNFEKISMPLFTQQKRQWQIQRSRVYRK